MHKEKKIKKKFKDKNSNHTIIIKFVKDSTFIKIQNYKAK